MTHHHALPTGTRIGPYEVQSVLGVGGFGVTYKAFDQTLQRPVAVKEYLPATLAIRTSDKITVAPKSDGDTRDYEYGLKRFLDEARTLARFAEPNIVRVITYLEEHGTAYFVMDYEDGVCLDTHLKTNISLTEERIRDIALPLLKGLRTVHHHNFLHRDIKPLNIYLRKSGSPVLLDFGAARQALNNQSRAMTGMVTPGYAPFEQYLNDGTQGPWTDIYAMGATLFHCAIGVTPDISTERIAALHSGKPDPIRTHVPHLEKKVGYDLCHLIMWMLGPMPHERPQTVDEVIEALEGRRDTPKLTVLNTGDAVVDPGSMAATLPPEALAAIEESLQEHIGPLSRILVKRVASQATNMEMLTDMLSNFIDSEDARRTFLSHSRKLTRSEPRGSGPRTSAPRSGRRSDPTVISNSLGAVADVPIDAERLAKIETLVSRHLGPIARVLVRKAAARARNARELGDILADEFQDLSERSSFLNEFRQL